MKKPETFLLRPIKPEIANVFMENVNAIESGELNGYKFAELTGIESSRKFPGRAKKQGYTISPSGKLYLNTDSIEYWKYVLENVDLETHTLNSIHMTLDIKPPSFKKTYTEWFGYEPTLKIGNRSLKYNEHIFDTIDTEEKAYWLGFIMGDGNILESRYCLSIKLGDVDKEHVKKFITFISGDHSLLKKEVHTITGNRLWKAAIYNKYLATKLMDDYNILPRKSCVEIPPTYDQVPKELMRHYLRGLFDADGSIHSDFGKCSFVDGKDLVLFFRDEFVKDNPDLKHIPNILCKSKNMNDTSLYTFEVYNHKDKTTFLNWLYKDANVYLDRKLNMYNEFNDVFW